MDAPTKNDKRTPWMKQMPKDTVVLGEQNITGHVEWIPELRVRLTWGGVRLPLASSAALSMSSPTSTSNMDEYEPKESSK